MSKAWIEDLWLTEPRETLPDGSKVKIPVPSSVTKMYFVKSVFRV